MVQCNIVHGRTESGKVNARWYLERLKTSANSRKYHSNSFSKKEISLNDQIGIVEGNSSKEGQQQHIPTIRLRSSTQSFQSQSNLQKYVEQSGCLNSLVESNIPRLKSVSSSIKKGDSSLSDLNCNSSQSLIRRNEKENFSERRSSSNTIVESEVNMINRPPSTPVDPRCHRGYSCESTSIDREVCSLLGPQLCSDCIEIQTRSNLSSERLPIDVMRQRLSALSLRPFLKDQQIYSDDDLLKMVNNQQIQIHLKNSNQIHSSILSDEEYFNHLSLSLKQRKSSRSFYFRNLKDFSEKYQSNRYPRLYLHETPSPISSNPHFQKGSFEKFDISSKYSFMKKASTVKPNLQTKGSVFISPKKSEAFYNEHRYLIDYSPPLLLQRLQENVRNNSNHLSSTQIQTQKRSLINSKSSPQQFIQV